MPAHERMTPEQALGYAAQREFDDVLIVGFDKSDGHFVQLGSLMSRQQAMWLLEWAKHHAMHDGYEGETE